jgi:hypothetical protein
MSELRPLLEGGADDWEESLLRAVRAEEPNPSGLQQTALALGLSAPAANALAQALTSGQALGHAGGAAVGGVSSVAASGSAGVSSSVGVAGAASGIGGAATTGAASLGLLGKSLVGGALVSFLALTTVDRAVRHAGGREPPATATSSRLVAASEDADAVRASPARPGATTPQAPAAPPLGAPTASNPGRQPHRATLVPSSNEAPPDDVARAPANAAFGLVPAAERPTAVSAENASLATETRLLDGVRAALAAGDSARAGSLLDSYAAHRPSPILAQEAELLRVRWLLQLGRRHAAAELARRIIHAHPTSTHVDSLRRLAAEP